MSFFERFKKKEEPAKKEEPKKEVKCESKGKDAAWATSRDKPVREEEKKIEEDKMVADEKKKAAKPAPAKKSDSKVWHITKREEDGQWQVRAEGAARATKLFRTKAEAEEYVKTLKSNNEGSRVVKHKKTGEFQKK